MFILIDFHSLVFTSTTFELRLIGDDGNRSLVPIFNIYFLIQYYYCVCLVAGLPPRLILNGDGVASHFIDVGRVLKQIYFAICDSGSDVDRHLFVHCLWVVDESVVALSSD